MWGNMYITCTSIGKVKNLSFQVDMRKIMALSQVNRVISSRRRDAERLKSKQLFRMADKVVPSADWDGKIETESRPQSFTPKWDAARE